MNATSPGSPLLGPGDVRALVEELELRPTKRRGQNFVTDPNTIRRIVRAAELGPGETVLEIGPGLGSLTLGLLAADHCVVAVEVDVRLAEALPTTVARFAPSAVDRLSVVTLDALTLEPDALGGPSPTALVANLPYNVAVPALLRVFERLPSVRHGMVMVQLEVAERLAAQPGSRAYGIPSAKAAWYADVRQAGVVPRTVFWPAPNVDSGLVTFTRRDPPIDTTREGEAARDAAAGETAGAPSRASVFAVVDAAFASRRKMLRGSLATLAGSPAAAETALRAAGVDPHDRGERLDIAAFARVAAHLPDSATDPTTPTAAHTEEAP